MDNITPVNSDSLTPPTPPVVDVAQPGTAVSPQVVKEAESLKGAEWPVKKTSNIKKVFAGIAAIVLVVGVSIGAFYFTRNLNEASVPNAPESTPYAGYTPPVFKGKNVDDNVTNIGTGKQVEYGQYGGTYNTADRNKDDTPEETRQQMAALNEQAQKKYGVNAEGSQADNRTGAQLAGQSDFGGINYSGFYQVADGSYRPIAAPEEKRGGREQDEVATTTTRRGGNNVASCTVSSWTPAENTVCSGTAFTQTSNCATTRSATGTKTDGACFVCSLTQPSNPSVEKLSPTSVKLKWTPGTGGGVAQYLYVSKNDSPVANCNGDAGVAADCILKKTDLATTSAEYTLTGLTANTTYYWNIQNHLSTACNKFFGSPATFKTDIACTDTTWTPDAATKCQGTSFIQTSNCSATRSATGTKTTAECEKYVDLEVLKTAYRDQATNTAGNYKLTSEIDVVSKEQVFVYAIDVANNGNIKAENVVITDVLKGDNQELLTFVDAESRCKYTSATRTVTCSGMNLEPDDTDTYTFRVKVSADAVNGDSIKNTVVATYKDMPANGDTEATLDLPVSTIVGCNHTCTGDDECVSGLSCDLTTNKCRKPTCSDSSNCNCPVAATPAPVRVATARPIQPTVLPETGILDLPGVATFGGGLLLAVIGILLAL